MVQVQYGLQWSLLFEIFLDLTIPVQLKQKGKSSSVNLQLGELSGGFEFLLMFRFYTLSLAFLYYFVSDLLLDSIF